MLVEAKYDVADEEQLKLLVVNLEKHTPANPVTKRITLDELKLH